jgi:GAF domain-containing protein
MLKRQHKLRLDMKSIVGYTAARGEARIALDVGSDSVFFNNPDLPETRSEMALPLRTGERVIGVLDVQSTQPNAFTEEDINVLATLADQVAVAIENARLFSEARQALQESEQTFARYIKQEWSSFARRAKTTGYLFDGQRAAPLQEKNGHASLAALPQTGRLSMEGESDTLTIPLRVKGQIIGALKVRPKTSRQWRDDELTLLETAAERAALALENARLVDSAQRRASRERLISEISSKVGAVSEMDTIMQTAVEELGRRLGSAAEVILELEKD